VDSFSPAAAQKRITTGGEGGRNREREIRSPDVYSLYTVSKGFRNKIEKNHSVPQSQTCMQGIHIYSGLRFCYVTLRKTDQLDGVSSVFSSTCEPEGHILQS